MTNVIDIAEGRRKADPHSAARKRAEREMREWASHGLTGSEVHILDVLIPMERGESDDHPAGPVPINDLFSKVAHTFTGHHAVVAALAAGEIGTDEQLAKLGRRAAFNAAVGRLKDRGALEEDADGRLHWTGVTPDLPTGEPYEVGREALASERTRVNQRIIDALPKYGGFSGLFPRMSEEELETLAEDMRLNDFDQDLPVIADEQTREIIDGYNRMEAAQRAGKTPRIVYRQMDALERLQLTLRYNLNRRDLKAQQRQRVLAFLSRIGLTTRHIAELARVNQSTVVRSVQAESQLMQDASVDSSSGETPFPTSGHVGPRGPWASLAQRTEAEDFARDLADQHVHYTEIAQRVRDKFAVAIATTSIGNLIQRARARTPKPAEQNHADQAAPAEDPAPPVAPAPEVVTDAPPPDEDVATTTWDKLFDKDQGPFQAQDEPAQDEQERDEVNHTGRGNRPRKPRTPGNTSTPKSPPKSELTDFENKVELARLYYGGMAARDAMVAAGLDPEPIHRCRDFVNQVDKELLKEPGRAPDWWIERLQAVLVAHAQATGKPVCVCQTCGNQHIRDAGT